MNVIKRVGNYFLAAFLSLFMSGKSIPLSAFTTSDGYASEVLSFPKHRVSKHHKARALRFLARHPNRESTKRYDKRMDQSGFVAWLNRKWIGIRSAQAARDTRDVYRVDSRKPYHYPAGAI